MPLSDNKDVIGIALVGSGDVNDRHAAVVAASPGVQIAGVFDLDDKDQMSGSFDALLVDAEAPQLAALAPAFERMGVPVLAETPTGSVPSAWASGGSAVVMVRPHRYTPGALTVKSVVAGGDLGSVVLARVVDLGRGSENLSGERLAGIPAVDLARWLVDDRPVSVYAQGHRATGSDEWRYVNVMIRFDRGATALCEFGTTADGGTNNEIFLQGTHGAMTLPSAVGFTPESGPSQEVAFRRQLDDFVDQVRHGRVVADSNVDFQAAVEMAVVRSLASGDVVTLDIEAAKGGRFP